MKLLLLMYIQVNYAQIKLKTAANQSKNFYKNNKLSIKSTLRIIVCNNVVIKLLVKRILFIK